MIELGKKWLSRNIRMEAKIFRCVVRALKYNFANSMLAFVTIFIYSSYCPTKVKFSKFGYEAHTRHALSRVT